MTAPPPRAAPMTLPQPRILVVEDELLIAMSLETTLTGAGYAVVGPCVDLDGALRSLDEEEIDVALLDINLDGQMVFPVADRLKARGTPFAFLTGYGSASVPAPYAGWPIVTKPYRQDELLKVISQIAPAGASPTMAPPCSS